jgi:cyclophilin family peptidyl-prolyl cis-trans isomerase
MERKIPRSQVLRRLALAALFGIVGCGKTTPPAPEPQAAASPAPNAAGDQPGNGVETPAAAPDQTPDKDEFLRALGVRAETGQAVAKVDQVSFRTALRGSDDPPDDCDQPPDQTMTGKSVFKLLKQVALEWDKIVFVAPSGAVLHYTAQVQTNVGPIEITLRPDLAPNHVRNFVALARAGYYDGLCFDRVIHDESPEGPATSLDMVEAGCPLGIGDPITSHLGYWLKPEFVPKERAIHEEGTVGACRRTEVDTASCKFYINLTKNPQQLDGNFTIFGKVTAGLDTVRRISLGSVIEEDRAMPSRRPKNPVTIERVIITISEGAKG